MGDLRINTGRLFRLLAVAAAVIAGIAGTVRLLQPAELPPLPADVGLPGALASGGEPPGGPADELAGVVVEIPADEPGASGNKRRKKGARASRKRSGSARSPRPAAPPQPKPPAPRTVPAPVTPAPTPTPVPTPPQAPPTAGEFDFER